MEGGGTALYMNIETKYRHCFLVELLLNWFNFQIVLAVGDQDWFTCLSWKYPQLFKVIYKQTLERER